MNGLSKIIGGFLGFLLAGPGGGLLGILVGHIFDQTWIQVAGQYRFAPRDKEHMAEYVFFESTFLIMGYVAKRDGIVSKKTIQNARLIIQQMGLEEDYALKAMQLFNQGKQSDFSLDLVLQRLITATRYNRHLLKQFLEIQTQMVLSDGYQPSARKRQVLESIYHALGFNFFQFDWFEFAMHTAHQSAYQEEAPHQKRKRQSNADPFRYQTADITSAYRTLRLSPDASPTQVKHAYRRLRSEYHPDKLAFKKLSSTEIARANEKMQLIKAAYDKIREVKGFS